MSNQRVVTSVQGAEPRRMIAGGLDEPFAQATAPQADEQRA
ncbi:hypothetical protein [Cellulomonas cellasea]|uniref:Uncharacterized protein n=1 Tax=Cellulomonas cellasea TaxID=43670 RepID=A0A7W4YCY0_9CELL|nr:hypothetical protein [Cellulomonas cellasea]MBB2925480.1 hypothetical protein [Cellulomonas cellasea]